MRHRYYTYDGKIQRRNHVYDFIKLVWFVEIKIALLFLKKNKNIVIRNMDWLEVFIVPVSSIFIVMAIFIPLTDEYVWAKLIASILILMVNLFHLYNYNELQEKHCIRRKGSS